MFFKNNDSMKDILQVGGAAGTMGLHLVSATVVGLFMGYWLDKWLLEFFQLHTKPWLTMIFTILGIVSGFRMVLEDARKMQRQAEAEEKGPVNGANKQGAENGDDPSKD
ncbi:AtpZ/AtpI family protein [Pseudodesulfovibrio senegalensis]|jgi:ATP synthase protein I|uniref:AtpZ/AtpI family protein n=1 Tax=Pseudodesulfovibrio senegalensis TaxID=1721087 RepID=A0A6N6N435_9BACT|nr:AtpZ/AtpI family protein [Pseudodesulfovibrio senegalensis]KAB1441839.1 AtpZ/AtpI family protein [Pseudodesulfovibrio senegalensis]